MKGTSGAKGVGRRENTRQKETAIETRVYRVVFIVKRERGRGEREMRRGRRSQ